MVISGAIKLRVGNKSLEARAGDVVVTEPGEPHKVEEVIGKADYIVFNTNSDPLDKIVLE